MMGQQRIGTKFFQGIEIPGQCHFIVEFMNSAVAFTTHVNAQCQRFSRKIFSEKCAPVHLTGNQVMESEGCVALTQAAIIRFYSRHDQAGSIAFKEIIRPEQLCHPMQNKDRFVTGPANQAL